MKKEEVVRGIGIFLLLVVTVIVMFGIVALVEDAMYYKSYTVSKLNNAPKPEAYLFTTTDKDGNIIEDGIKSLDDKSVKDSGVTGQKIIATSIPCSGPEDGMIYTTFTGHGVKDGKTYEVLYINEPTHRGKWVAASLTDPEGNTTLYTFMYNGETIYDRWENKE